MSSSVLSKCVLVLLRCHDAPPGQQQPVARSFEDSQTIVLESVSVGVVRLQFNGGQYSSISCVLTASSLDDKLGVGIETKL
ncbi:unnamed protein product [Phytophthora fragariaefolia]|uniref:Unnamed protein product n=1 Tax=Phytophthora fragariaefolia TaxID=1490495 RepID=A0A9W7CQF9_9STRA|nr:unnamed protein product [Phytophthora fragariaefolia]